MPDSPPVSFTRPFAVTMLVLVSLLTSVFTIGGLWAVQRHELADVIVRVARVESTEVPTAIQMTKFQEGLDYLQKDLNLQRASSERMEQNTRAALERIEASLKAGAK